MLRLAPPTLSGQIRELERAVGETLFVRTGRRLALTEAGVVAYGYAEQIFGLGRELLDTLKGRSTGASLRLSVGLVDAVPRTFAAQLLAPVLAPGGGARLVVREDAFERLLQDLVAHTLDLVIADVPVPAGSGLRAYNHEIAECGVSFFAAPSLAARLEERPFPACLHGAPMLFPAEGTPLRRSLERWLGEQELAVRVVGEIGDAALTKVLAADGVGVCVAPALIEAAIAGQYGLRAFARTEGIRERFFLVTGERRIRHPLTLRIMEGRPWARAALASPP